VIFLRNRHAKFLIAAISMAAIGVGLVIAWAFGPVDTDDYLSREFTVQTGWGGARIASELKEAGLIRSSTAFIVYTNLTRTGDALQAGTYMLVRTMSLAEVVRTIASGKAVSDDLWVTIPEGMNIWEVDRLLVAAGIIRAGELRTAYSAKEGHLFPETYRFAKDATVDDVVRKIEATYFERGGTRSDIDVIIASILEKEAKSPEDMAIVAGIIRKRMEIGMALQIDATVGYGWCVRTAGFTRDCDVTQAPIAREIEVDGPYNTYTRRGLPVGPISNPGSAALQATSSPAKSDYLYYLSTRDGSQLIYAKTLDEHLENRAKYLGF
jgi:UPF0755 protein